MRIGTFSFGLGAAPALLGLVGVAGCAASGPDTRPTGGGPLASSTASAGEVAPSASASAALPPGEAKANVSAFGYVLTTEQRIDLFQVDDAAFAITQAMYQPTTYKIDDASVSEVDLFKTLKVAVQEGDPIRYFRIESMRGSANGDLDITYNQPGERGGTTYDASFRKAAWKVENQHGYFGDCWGGKCTVVDGNYLIVDEENAFSLSPPNLMAPKPKGWVPVASKSGAPAGCKTRLAEYAQIGTVDGSVYAIGKLCTGAGTTGDMAIETWKKGSATSTVAELPGKRAFDTTYASVTKELDAWFLVAHGAEEDPRPYVARFDGKSWSDVTPPAKSEVRLEVMGSKKQLFAFAHEAAFRRDGEAWTTIPFPARTTTEGYDAAQVAPDDAIWLILDEKLYRLEANGAALARVALPDPPADGVSTDGKKELTAYDVRFSPNGDPIVAALFGASNYLLVPTKRAPSKPMVAATPASKKAFGDVKPATAGCQKPFVVLYGMTKVAPDDYDFPLTRKALKGKTKYKGTRFWVTRDAGQRFLIARVGTVDLGHDLVKDIASGVKDSSPQLLCGDPAETIRELKIDLATGDVVK